MSLTCAWTCQLLHYCTLIHVIWPILLKMWFQTYSNVCCTWSHTVHNHSFNKTASPSKMWLLTVLSMEHCVEFYDNFCTKPVLNSVRIWLLLRIECCGVFSVCLQYHWTRPLDSNPWVVVALSLYVSALPMYVCFWIVVQILIDILLEILINFDCTSSLPLWAW